MGHKMGHFENVFLIIYLISINYICLRVRPSHHINLDAKRRLFLCLKSPFCNPLLAFSLNLRPLQSICYFSRGHNWGHPSL